MNNPAPLVFHGCVFVAKRGRIHTQPNHGARRQTLPCRPHPAARPAFAAASPPCAPGGCGTETRRGSTSGSTPPALTPAFSCLQSSGVQVMPDCLTEFEAMKIRSAYKVCSPLRASLQRAEEQERPFLTC